VVYRVCSRVAAAAALGVIAGGWVNSATAQSLSSGCNLINDPTRDGLYSSLGPFSLPFAENELIELTASDPTTVGTPTSITLTVGGSVVSTDSFPGSLSYQFPSDPGTTSVGWGTDGGNVTWTASCSLAPPQAVGTTEAVPALPPYALLLSALGLVYLGRRGLATNVNR